MSTICNLFHSDYIKMHKDLNALKKVFGYEYVATKYGKSFFQNVCVGAYDYEWERRGITAQQLSAAVDFKFMQHHSYSNYEARLRKQTDFYRITVKGIRALYEAFNDWDGITVDAE